VGLGARALACTRARVALLIQPATSRHIAIFGLPGSTTFFHSFINGMIFGGGGGKFHEHKMCVFILFSLQLFFELFLILRRIQRDVINERTA
jgi:hypothetical protein